MMLMHWAPGAHPGIQNAMRRLCAAHDSNRLLPAACCLLAAACCLLPLLLVLVLPPLLPLLLFSADAYCLVPAACCLCVQNVMKTLFCAGAMRRIYIY